MNIKNQKIPFNGFITNQRMYNEGEWVKFPTSATEMVEVFGRLMSRAIDRKYDKYFISEFEINADGISTAMLDQHANLDELNYLASKIAEMAKIDYEYFCAIINRKGYNPSVNDLINTIANIGAFEVLPDVKNFYDLGYYYIEEAGIFDISKLGVLGDYIDYERYGKKVANDELGTFTDYGYVKECDSVECIYKGVDDIPDKYRLTSLLITQNNKSSIMERYRSLKNIWFQ